MENEAVRRGKVDAMLKGKFANVPLDPDTKIRAESLVTLGEIEALYQRWYWEGIGGESLIFVSEEVEGLGNEALKKLAASSSLIQEGSDFTIKRNQRGFTFVNFNFLW